MASKIEKLNRPLTQSGMTPPLEEKSPNALTSKTSETLLRSDEFRKATESKHHPLHSLPGSAVPSSAGRNLGFDVGSPERVTNGAVIPPQKDGPVDPNMPNRPTRPGPIVHYEWWMTDALARGDQPTTADLTKLAHMGFKSVINLRAEDNSDEATCKQNGMNYLHVNWVDKTAPSEDQIKQMLDFATDPANGPAFIHCLAGQNRTSVAAACYRMAVEGWSLDQTMTEAKSFGLHEPVQIQFVQQFAQDLAAGKIAGYPLTSGPPPPPTPSEVKGSATPAAPLKDKGSVSSTIQLAPGVSIDKLTLNLDISHTRSTGLSVTVTSPSGKTATVPIPPGNVKGQFDLSTAFAGEQTGGIWTLTVNDSRKTDKGTFNAWSLDAVGKAPPPPPPPPAGGVKLYEMPDATSTPILDAINGAKKSVDLSIYLMTDQKVIDTLKAAAGRGVKVRVMIEPNPVGSTGTSNFTQLQQELTAAGCQVEPTPPQFDSHNNVDHAKFMVVDGAETLLGTGNLVNSSLEAPTGDRDFWLDDTRAETVSEAETLFNDDSLRQNTTGVTFKNLVVTPDNASARMLGFIDSAKAKLLVYNQELQDPDVIQHLIAAKQRGVDVQVLAAAPRASGNPDKNAAGIQQLKAAGIDAREMSSHYLHAKAMVADNQAFVGSQNFSADGLTANRELGEIVDDPQVVAQLTQDFMDDKAAN